MKFYCELERIYHRDFLYFKKRYCISCECKSFFELYGIFLGEEGVHTDISFISFVD